jgi:hypothetical protein
VLPPNLGVISSLFNKEFVSMSSNLFLEYAKFFILDRGFTKISAYLLIYGDILENHFSFLDLITENVMLDLNVLRSFWNTEFSLKASYSS